MSADPHLAAVEDFIVTVVEQVRLGELHDADALAALAADCLGLSLQDHVHPDTADELLGMAQAFAAQRHAIVNSRAATIPDDIGDLDVDS